MKQGKDCSLLLDCKNDKITTCLKVTQFKTLEAKVLKIIPTTKPQAVIKKKRGKKKCLQKILAFEQRLVNDKGLPPSRLMLQHAAAPVSSHTTQPDHKQEQDY